MTDTALETLLEQLLEAGEHPGESLLQEIENHGKAAVPRLIEIATDSELIWAESDSPEVWAPTHAMHLLGRLRAATAVTPLITLLEEEKEAEWIWNELPDVLAQIGPPAIEPLKIFTAQRSHSPLGRSAASESLTKIAKSHPETRREVIDFLRTLLPAHPDEKPGDEIFRGFVITDLLDLKAKGAYPDIEAAFVEDRVDDSIVGLDYVQHELDIHGGAKPRERGEFEIRLKCLECDFVRPHAVDVIYYDLGTRERKAQGEKVPYSEYIIPQRIVCPRCGAVDRYEITGEAYLAMTAELLQLAVPGKPAPGLGGSTEHVQVVNFRLEGGQTVHPLEAVEMYQRQVEAIPDDVGLRLRYGNVLRFLGRWDEARAQYEGVQTLDPDNADVYFSLAQMAEMQKDLEGALVMYEEYLSRVPRRPRGKEAGEAWNYAQEAVELLRHHQADVSGQAGGTIDRAGRAEAQSQPRSRRQGKKTARKARKAQRRPKKRKRKRKKRKRK